MTTRTCAAKLAIRLAIISAVGIFTSAEASAAWQCTAMSNPNGKWRGTATRDHKATAKRAAVNTCNTWGETQHGISGNCSVKFCTRN
jgi:hypothetical protein